MMHANSKRLRGGLMLAAAVFCLIAAVSLLVVTRLPGRAAYTAVIFTPGSLPVAPELNAIAPPISGETLSGAAVTLDALRGGPVVVNFWATWCAPCRVEMPELQRLYETYRDDGLRVVGVNLGETAEQVQAWRESFGLGFDLVVDPAAQTAADYRIRGQPSTYVISPQGVITHIFYGPVDMPTLRAALDPFLG